jgi:hypothetical protein
MWTCPLCNQQFKHNNQTHYCTNHAILDFLKGKSEQSIWLYQHFAQIYLTMGDIKPHATKTMIAFKSSKNFAYVIRLGKNFIDIVLPFKTAYMDNLCFSKIVQVPGTNDYNHHLRIYHIEDVNDEVQHYMREAYKNGKGI